MNAVKNYVLERIGEITLWQRIQRLIFQTGAFMAIIASISCINSPAGENKVVSSHTTTVTDNFNRQFVNGTQHTSRSKNSDAINIVEKINIEQPIILVSHGQKISDPITFIPPAETHPSLADSKVQSLSETIVPQQTERTSMRAFAEMQGVAAYDHARIYGGGVSAGIIHDWQIVTLHFTDASGTRDDRNDNLNLSNMSRIKGETAKQFAIMFGGIIEQGRFSTSLQLGPSYGMTAITSGVKGIPASNTIANQNMLGMSAQFSAGYRFSDFLSANIEGFFGYRSAFSKGIMMSIMIQP
jgi:hypothetical protein